MGRPYAKLWKVFTYKKLAIFSQKIYHFVMSRASKEETQGTSEKSPFCFSLNINNHSRPSPPLPILPFHPDLVNLLTVKKY